MLTIYIVGALLTSLVLGVSVDLNKYSDKRDDIGNLRCDVEILLGVISAALWPIFWVFAISVVLANRAALREREHLFK